MSTIVAAKKNESIAEYIIYMYQTEDLILNYKLNLDDILEYVIKHMSQNDEVIKEQLLWYADIIDQMQNEEIINSNKRLHSTQQYVDQLTSIHERYLLTDKIYQDKYLTAEKDIKHHITLSDNAIANPVQICLNGIYGMLLLKLNGKKVSAAQKSMLTNFGALLEYLSEAYKKEHQPSE